jgi:aspartokinase/homoserine dehydrogenase 1
VIVDCSASDSVAARYPAWLAAGIHVITPNKHAGAAHWTALRAIREAARAAAHASATRPPSAPACR